MRSQTRAFEKLYLPFSNKINFSIESYLLYKVDALYPIIDYLCNLDSNFFHIRNNRPPSSSTTNRIIPFFLKITTASTLKPKLLATASPVFPNNPEATKKGIIIKERAAARKKLEKRIINATLAAEARRVCARHNFTPAPRYITFRILKKGEKTEKKKEEGQRG